MWVELKAGSKAASLADEWAAGSVAQRVARKAEQTAGWKAVHLVDDSADQRAVKSVAPWAVNLAGEWAVWTAD
jgi:hypothetical protein